jgi:hypothetical protein
MSTKEHYCQIRMANRSSQAIRFVTLDPDGRSTDFGFFDVGGGHATAAACHLSFAHDLAIQWKEDGAIKRSTVNLSPYASRVQDIRSMSFYYLGDGKWQVVAQDGDHLDSKTIDPN